MSNRGRLILAILLTLAGKVSAQNTPLQVQVYDYAELQPSALRKFTTLTEDILINAGLSVHVEACARGVQSSCKTETANARNLVIRVVAGQAKKMSNVRHPPLGLSFADHDGGTYASLFLERVQDEAAEFNVPWITVLAYAAAHEVGHLLLGSGAHTVRGVMKAHWGRLDYEAMNQNYFRFSEEQIRQLARQYGSVSRSETNSQAALETNHSALAIRPIQEFGDREMVGFLVHLRHPDVAVDLGQINQHLVPGDAEIRHELMDPKGPVSSR